MRTLKLSLLAFVFMFSPVMPHAVADEVITQQSEEAQDPLEILNRAIFGFNYALDTLIIRPISYIYGEAIPDPIQNIVQNFLRNLRTPLIIADNILQADLDNAWIATQRLIINTSIGIGGALDIAEMNGLHYEYNDMGLTFARWSVKPGPYLVLPIIGASNFRDAIGTGFDTLADPLNIYAQHKHHYTLPLVRDVMTVVDYRSKNIQATDTLERDSVDYYATIRSLYFQKRQSLVTKQKMGDQDFPDYASAR